MTGGQVRPLQVAGVAGGVGTSTFVRILESKFPGNPVVNVGIYRPELPQMGGVDVLVTSNLFAAASKVAGTLGTFLRPPLLVVMHVGNRDVPATRSHLRKVNPYISARFDIHHKRAWWNLTKAPTASHPADLSDLEALDAFPTALTKMYQHPPRRPVAVAPPAPPLAAPPQRLPLQRLPTGSARAGPGSSRWPPPVDPQAAFRAGPVR